MLMSLCLGLERVSSSYSQSARFSVCLFVCQAVCQAILPCFLFYLSLGLSMREPMSLFRVN